MNFKRGGSPVTGADLAVDAYLLERLPAAFPEAGWLSEETADDLARLDRAELIIVDPIDGTRAFFVGDPRWAVSIAFVSDGRPIAGVVHAPALGETYAAAYGCGATRDGVRLVTTPPAPRPRPAAGGPKALIAAVSAASGVEWEVVPRIPSLALRLARVAGGEPDLAFASTNSHDWDIAAADVVLREAGAELVGVPRPVARIQRAAYPPRGFGGLPRRIAADVFRSGALGSAPGVGISLVRRAGTPRVAFSAAAGQSPDARGARGFHAPVPRRGHGPSEMINLDAARQDSKPSLRLVLGGELKDLDSLAFRDRDHDDVYDRAEGAWRGRTPARADNATARDLIVHLHRFLQPKGPRRKSA